MTGVQTCALRSINGTVIFKIQDISEKFTGSRLLIYDAVTGTENDLDPGMDYKVSLPKGDYNGRFFLNYSNFITKIEENDASSDPFTVYFSNGVLKTEILNISGNNSRLRMFSLTGHELFNRVINAPGYYEFSPHVRDGIYIVMYSTGSVISSKKIFIKN